MLRRSPVSLGNSWLAFIQEIKDTWLSKMEKSQLKMIIMMIERPPAFVNDVGGNTARTGKQEALLITGQANACIALHSFVKGLCVS